MKQVIARQEDERLEKERRRVSRGTARVRLEALQFPHQTREIDAKRVEYLEGCFREYGCRPLPKKNHICAVLDQDDLVAAMRASGVTLEELLSNPPDNYVELWFPDGYRLECLHGKHRIQAACDFLQRPSDRWWVVDLYISDLDPELRIWLTEEFANEERPSDGQMYRKIRQYHFQRHHSLEAKWISWLRGNRAKNLKGLIRQSDLAEAFDTLLDIPGLWDGMKLTMLPNVVAFPGREYILHYLSVIRECFWSLAGGDRDALAGFDAPTVKALELRAPRASTADLRELEVKIRHQEILTPFSDEERGRFQTRLVEVRGMIPTLYTFFRDFQYLEACTNSIRWLVPPVGKGKSLAHIIERHLTPAQSRNCEIILQVSEDGFSSKLGTPVERADLVVRQLYAFAMRYYDAMPLEPKQENRVTKAVPRADRAVLRKFADLAARLGVRSDQITDMQRYPESSTTHLGPGDSRPTLVTSARNQTLRQRCGLPHASEHNAARPFIFVQNLHDEQDSRGRGITPFFVRQSVYFAFFGGRDSGTGGNIPAGPSPLFRDPWSDPRRAPPPRRGITPLANPEPGGNSHAEDDLSSAGQERGPLAATSTHQNETAPPMGRDMEVQLYDDQESTGQSGAGLTDAELDAADILDAYASDTEMDDFGRNSDASPESTYRADRDLDSIMDVYAQDETQSSHEQPVGVDDDRESTREQPVEDNELEVVSEAVSDTEAQGAQQRWALAVGEELERSSLEEEEFDERTEPRRNRDEQEAPETLREAIQELPDAVNDRPLEEDRGLRDTVFALEELLPTWAASKSSTPSGSSSRDITPKPTGIEDPAISPLKDTLRNEDGHTQARILAPVANDQTVESGLQERGRDISPEIPPQPPPMHGPAESVTIGDSNQDRIRINIKLLRGGGWKDLSPLMIDSSDPSEVERSMRYYIRHRIRPYDTGLSPLYPGNCFKRVTENRTNMILLIPEAEMNITKNILDSVARIQADCAGAGLKRKASDDIGKYYQARKGRLL